MKKAVMASFVFVTLLSCGNSGNNNNGSTTGTNDSGYNDIRGVENLNGNIPDTTATGATPHSDHPPMDSSRLRNGDTMHK